MRPNSNNNRRARGRGGRKSGNSRNQTYDSNGPGARVRGNPSQIYEKYQQLARDAASAGDRVGAENYLQHAEHYYRLMAAAAAKNEQRNASEEGARDEGSRDDSSRNDPPRDTNRESNRDSGDGHGSFVENLQAEDSGSDGDSADGSSQDEKAAKSDDSGSRPNGRKRRSRRGNGRAAAADSNADADGNVAEEPAGKSDDGDAGGDDGEAATA